MKMSLAVVPIVVVPMILTGCANDRQFTGRVSDSWGERISLTTNIEAVYPPRDNLFPGDVIAMCFRAPVGKERDELRTNENAPSKTVTGNNRSTFDGQPIARMKAFLSVLLDDSKDTPHITTAGKSYAPLMELRFNNDVLPLARVAFPTTTFVSQKTFSGGITGTTSAVTAGIGASRTAGSFYSLAVPKATYVSLRSAKIDEAINESFDTQPELYGEMVKSLSDLGNRYPDCNVQPVVIYRVYYTTEISYSYGDTLAQAVAAQAQLYTSGKNPDNNFSGAKAVTPDIPGPPAAADAGVKTIDDKKKDAMALEQKAKDQAEKALENKLLGVRVNASSSESGGVSFQYTYSEPIAFAASYLRLEDEGSHRSLPVDADTSANTTVRSDTAAAFVFADMQIKRKARKNPGSNRDQTVPASSQKPAQAAPPKNGKAATSPRFRPTTGPDSPSRDPIPAYTAPPNSNM